jgi:hypothetical protein
VIRELVAGPYFAAAGLLVAGGVSKLRHPDPATSALAAARIPGPRIGARALGATETMAGVAALFVPSRAGAAAVAFLYLSFAAFIGLMATGRLAAPSCGCVGRREVPPGWLHVALDLGAFAAALVAAARPPDSVAALVGSTPLGGVPALAGIALIGALAYLAVAYVPELFFSYRRRPGVLAQRGGA